MNGGGNIGNVNNDSCLNVIENNVCEQIFDCYNSHVGSCQGPRSFVIPEKERDICYLSMAIYNIHKGKICAFAAGVLGERMYVINGVLMNKLSHTQLRCTYLLQTIRAPMMVS